jgi:hypothetical protein
MPRRRWLRAALAALAVASALAAPTGGPAAAEAAASGQVGRTAADLMTRGTLAWLRRQRDPNASAFRAAAMSLAVIRRLAPDDLELLRLEANALNTAGDRDRLLDVTRRILAIDPDDGPAQLRLALAGMSRLQTADARLAAYDRILGPRGARLSDAVRSRLALDAALMARENGDERRFLGLLTLASEIDPTNKDAAALYAATFMALSDDPFVRFDLLANVVLADPTDAQAYDNLSAELMRYGAFEGAFRMLNLYADIVNQRGYTLDPQHVFDFALCEWNTEGSDRALTRINRVLNDTIQAERNRRQAIIADGRDPGPERPMLLPPVLQLFRLAVAVGSREGGGAVAILDDYLIGSDLRLEALPGIDPGSQSPEEIESIRWQSQVIRLERLWAQLFAGAQLDEAEAFIGELQAGRDAEDARGDEPRPPGQPPAVDQEVLDRYRGWLLMHRGEDLLARQTLEPLIERDHLARWAYADLRDEQGAARDAARHYAILAKEHPRKAIGTAALVRLNALRDEPVVRSREAVRLDRRALEFAPWLEDFVESASEFMSLRLVPAERQSAPLEPIELELSLRNVSQWPIGIGKARPIPQRLLLAPKVRIEGVDVSDRTIPIVLSIDSRLRLDRGETLRIPVNARRQGVGVLLDNTAIRRADLRFQVVQGFSLGPSGVGIVPGPFTVSTLSDYASRTSLANDASDEDLAASLGSGFGVELLEAMLIGRARLVLARADAGNPDAERTAALVLNAWLDRLGSMASTERAIAIQHLSELGELGDPATAALVAASVGAPDDPYASVAALLALPRDAAAPLAERLLESDDAELAILAEAWLAADP